MARLGRSFPKPRPLVRAVFAGGSAAVAGLVSAWTVAAPAGTVTGTAAANVNGVVATWTVAAPVGSLTVPATVTGVTATWTVSAPAGSVTTGVVVAGATAAWTVAAPIGAPPVFGAVVNGGTAAWAVTAPVGAVPQGAVVAGSSATWTVSAPRPGLQVVERFEGPIVDSQADQWADDLALRFFTQNAGVTVVLYVDGTHREVQYPVDSDLTDPSVLFAFRGGYRYDVTPAQSAALAAAGYTTSFVFEPA